MVIFFSTLTQRLSLTLRLLFSQSKCLHARRRQNLSFKPFWPSFSTRLRSTLSYPPRPRCGFAPYRILVGMVRKEHLQQFEHLFALIGNAGMLGVMLHTIGVSEANSNRNKRDLFQFEHLIADTIEIVDERTMVWWQHIYCSLHFWRYQCELYFFFRIILPLVLYNWCFFIFMVMWLQISSTVLLCHFQRPGTIMAIGRLNRPGITVYGGGTLTRYSQPFKFPKPLVTTSWIAYSPLLLYLKIFRLWDNLE